MKTATTTILVSTFSKSSSSSYVEKVCPRIL